MQQDPDCEETSGAGRGKPAPSSFEGKLLSLLPSLRRYARSLTRNHADGEDLLQDAVERALAHQGQWSGANMRSWTFSIMTNAFQNRLQRKNRFLQTGIEQAEVIADEQEMPDPFRQRKLAAAIDSLPPDQRSVLMLVVVEGYSYSEVAEIMGSPIGTVMSRLSRARTHLAERLDHDNVIALRRSE
jgi:RNA polymerase sigma-70 factor, ECF subfamily